MVQRTLCFQQSFVDSKERDWSRTLADTSLFRGRAPYIVLIPESCRPLHIRQLPADCISRAEGRVCLHEVGHARIR